MTVGYLHNMAIELAEMAFFKKSKGDLREAQALFAKAFDNELEAANTAKQEKVGEPTESILFRSAAPLAFNAKKYSTARELVYRTLKNDPPKEITIELLDLLEKIKPFDSEMLEGTVKFFNESTGFGFITPNSGGNDIFVHVSGLIDEIRENDIVTFVVEKGQKGLNATKVTSIPKK